VLYLSPVDEEVSSEIDLLIAVSGETPFLCRCVTSRERETRHVALFVSRRTRSYFDRFTIASDERPRDSTYCIMMEYVDGEDLQAYVRRHKGRVPVTRRLLFNFLCSALDALSTLHGKFIAHRDVKPRNFIVTPSTSDDGTPHLTLIDLGLGVRLDERRAAPDDDAGTPAYFSPDMVAALYDDYMNSSNSGSGSSSGASRSDDDAGHGNASRSAADDDSSAAASGRVSREALYAGDLWALGASLYFLVTGDHIAPQFDWESPRLREVFDAILDFKLPKRKPGTKTVLFHDDTLIDRVICTCLQADPNKRSTASELLQLLKDEYEESEDDDDDDNDTDNDGADDTDDATEDVSTASRKRPLGRSTRSTSKVLDDASDDGDVADSLVVNSKPRRATRSAMGAVLLSPALERRKPSAAAAAPPPPPQQQQRMTTRRAQSIAAAAALAEMSPDEPKRSRRSTVILPTLTPRTLRLHNRRRVVVDDDDDDDEEEATDAKPRKGKGDKRKEDRGEAENGDDDDDDDDEAENEALVSAIEAPPTDEMELNARRSRINERLRPRTRQQTVAAAAALAASPRRTKRQRTAAAVVEGTLSDDEAERNPARRTRSSMRLRR
jgi:serine/threonine protein kinase